MIYVTDFFNSIFRKSNISVLIYLVFNIFVIGGIFTIFTENYLTGFLTGTVVYAVSLVIALSTVGEWILRLINGCSKIKRDDQLNKIEPIFKKVYQKAKTLDPNLPEDIQLYMYKSNDVNAFATGRKTICVSSSLFSMPDNQIEAILSHEFGHISEHDTDLILIVVVGNMIVTAIVSVIRFVIWIISLILNICSAVMGAASGDLSSIAASFFSSVTSALTLLFVDGVMWIWTTIGAWLVFKSSRENEYEADQFAVNLGYGKELCQVLDSFEATEKKGLFAMLNSTHPEEDARIAKMQESGVEYFKNY